MAKKSAPLPKQKGWFSRRHQTNEAHLEARAKFFEKRNNKKSRALDRASKHGGSWWGW